MIKAQPIIVAPLFSTLLERLLETLSKLSREEWQKPTPCPGWSVQDIALHLLDGDIGQLSRHRDTFKASLIRTNRWEELVDLLNQKNEQWVKATRGTSPRVLLDLLSFNGGQANQYFATLDPLSKGPGVAWAGTEPTPMWLHIAREYTERWHHQQQIREAIGKSALTQPSLFAPVLSTFVNGLPRAYAGITAPTGTKVKLSITGDSGGHWYLVRGQNSWVLSVGEGRPDAQLTIDQIDAWKLFTKSLTKEEVRPRVKVEGDSELALKALDTISIIA